MDGKKVCFICCSNDELYMEECKHYLAHLDIPDGYGTDLLAVTGASSMAAGYNEAMRMSDAKYKVYLHQDVFILNQRFLPDILSIFASDPGIAMVGMVGYPRVSEDGIMWHERISPGSNLYLGEDAEDYPPRGQYQYSLELEGYRDVAVADGCLLATSVDLPWDEEHFDGWHLYDAAHCMEFLEEGYRIVVPVQCRPWCLHDDGRIQDLRGYDHYRWIFMNRWRKYLGYEVGKEEPDRRTEGSETSQWRE